LNTDSDEADVTSLGRLFHTNTSSLNFYRPRALPDAQPCQSTEGIYKDIQANSITTNFPLEDKMCVGGNLVNGKNALFYRGFLKICPISWKIHEEN